MPTPAAPALYTIDDVADAHAAGRFVMVNIDHQLCMQYERIGVDYTRFHNYNAEYEHAMNGLRRYGVPMIHVAYDFDGHYRKRDDAEKKFYDTKIQSFYRDETTLTVRAAVGAMRDGERHVKTDIIHTIRPGEILLFKDDESVHTNPDFDRLMAANGWDVTGYAGEIDRQCVRKSMLDSSASYGVAGLTDLIESDNPSMIRDKRIDMMTRYFKGAVRTAILSNSGDFLAALNESCAPA